MPLFSAPFRRFRNRIQSVTQEMHSVLDENHQQRTAEICEFEEALANGRTENQLLSIQLVDEFLSEKEIFVAETKNWFNQMRELEKSEYDQYDSLLQKQLEMDEISGNFMATIDSLWYALMELETSMHERTMKSFEIFNNDIQSLTENLITQSVVAFDKIQSASDEHLSSINKEKRANTKNVETVNNNDLNVINQTRDAMQSRAENWMTELTSKYKSYVSMLKIRKNRLHYILSLYFAFIFIYFVVFFFWSFVPSEEYNRNRIRVLEVNNFIDAQRTAYTQLKESVFTELQSPSIRRI